MAYFLKKVNRNGKVYLSIVDSFYDGSRGHTVHKTHSSYGTGEKLKTELGIDDPIAYLQSQVEKLNNEVLSNKEKKISNVSPEIFAGHFFIKAILNKLEIEPIMNAYDLTTNFQFRLFDILSALVFSRCIYPCSKYKTFNEIIPHLDENYNFSYDQLLEGLGWLGNKYEHIVEIFTKRTNEMYGINTSVNYFDCTNFYFEIDKEDDFRRKGPSKEKRTDPILGMGLLLDANQIPIGMKLYPGNQSEKPVIREIISDLKKKNGISTRIVQVADKGLNCAKNIYEALSNSDGYIFSKSIHGKGLSEKEKQWLLLENDANVYTDYRDKNGKLLFRLKSCVDTFSYKFRESDPETGKEKEISFQVKEKRIVSYNPSLAQKQKAEIMKMVDKATNYTTYKKMAREDLGDSVKYIKITNIDKNGKNRKPVIEINQAKIEEDLKYAGYNLLVTSELDMNPLQVYHTYHNLWKIEESFRITKSYLDARPVYVQKKETIYGHFLICYLSLFLLRILEIKCFKNEINSYDLVNFMRDFRVVDKGDGTYINISQNQNVNEKIKKLIGLTNLDALYLTEKEIENIFEFTMLIDS